MPGISRCLGSWRPQGAVENPEHEPELFRVIASEEQRVLIKLLQAHADNLGVPAFVFLSNIPFVASSENCLDLVFDVRRVLDVVLEAPEAAGHPLVVAL